MSTYIAKNSTVDFTGSSILSMELLSMSVDIAATTSDYTPMASVWEVSLAANKSWTVAFETTLDTVLGVDVGNTIGVSAAIAMDTVDGLSFAGTVVITGISVSAPQDEVATVSWTGKGSSALTNS